MKLFFLLVTIISSFWFGFRSPESDSNSPGAFSHETWDNLLKKYVSGEGNVDYRGFKKDSITLNRYLGLLMANPPDEKKWTRNQQMAYWINAYNAFTVQLIIRNYPLKSIKDIGNSIQVPFVNSPWDISFIKIGAEKLNLNNIEHGILRKKFNDARIHFCLVCASESCPPLMNSAYVADSLDNQMNRRTRMFINNEKYNVIKPAEIKISMIFSWYKGDFTSGNSILIDYLNRYSNTKINHDAKISFLDYDWGLNE